MGATTLGSVASIWRYPVKSMLGEELEAAEVSERGVMGDRAYALIDAEDGKLVSAKNPKKWPGLLSLRAEFIAAPGNDALPSVKVALPDGSEVTSDQSEIDEVLSAALGRKVGLASAPPGVMVMEEYWLADKGPEPYGQVSKSANGDVFSEAPAAFLAPGTFFDLSPVHLITTASLEAMSAANPQGRFDARRFRPNFLIETEGRDGFTENDWSGRVVAIGDSVRIEVQMPTPRCVMTTLAQSDLPKDPSILRTAAQHNRLDVSGLGNLPCAGVYGSVLQPGTVHRGDRVVLEN